MKDIEQIIKEIRPLQDWNDMNNKMMEYNLTIKQNEYVWNSLQKKPGKCNEPCEVYSRVCGYFRPVSNWNRGKRAEFKDRLCYEVNLK